MANGRGPGRTRDVDRTVPMALAPYAGYERPAPARRHFSTGLVCRALLVCEERPAERVRA
jgi:hypothetical protein